MTSSPKHSNRSARAAFITALVLVAPAALAAHFTGTGQDSAIGVHDGRYVAGGKTYGTLDALEAAVRASHPATLLIVSCTPAATRSWLEAVPRFEDLPMHPGRVGRIVVRMQRADAGRRVDGLRARGPRARRRAVLDATHALARN